MRKPIEDIISRTEKIYGKGTLGTLAGPHSIAASVRSVIPTGSMRLDAAMGIGGWPGGRVCEVFGPEGAGKTTLLLSAMARCQAAGNTVAFVDAEHALDPNYAESVGVHLDDLLVAQPDYGEQGLDIVLDLVKSGEIGLVCVDSVAALTPKAEIDGTMDDTQVGLQARMMSKAMRKLAGVVNTTGTCVIFSNQLRAKIGVTWGSHETTTGGNALKFYASMRVDVRKVGLLKHGESPPYGQRVRAKTVKNKLYPPFREVEFDVVYGRGIDFLEEILEAGIERGVIQKSGSWFAIGEVKLGQGREKAKAALTDEQIATVVAASTC